MAKKASINQYTPEGRAEMHKKPDMLLESIMHYIMSNPVAGRSIEYNDNRISLYMGQLGKCAITGEPLEIGQMHCHHKLPLHLGGTDEYKNLIFVTDTVHKLIHAANPDTISKYLIALSLNKKQLEKLNKLRKQAGNTQLCWAGLKEIAYAA